MDSKILLCLATLLLLSTAAYADWAETINVRAITSASYPIANQTVYINYQRQVSINDKDSVAIVKGTGVTGANCAASRVTITNVKIDPVTGVATYETKETKGSCTIGQGYIVPGNDTPTGLSSNSLGITGPWTVVKSDKTIDLRRLDGVIVGVTNASGEFEIGLIDYVSFGEVREYLVSVGKESRRVNVGENWVGTKHVETFVLNTTVRRIIAKTLDGDGAVLPNATVTGTCPLPFTGTSDEQGIFALYVRDGQTCQLTGKYGDVDETIFPGKVDRDEFPNLRLPLYDLSLRVVDDNGNPLRATITVPGSAPVELGADGSFLIKHFPAESVTLSILYNNRNQATPLDIKSSQPMTIVFDLTPPRISAVNSTINATSGIGRVRATVVDGGARPGQISSVYLRYSIDQKKWSRLPMYPAGAATFEAFLPEQAPGTTVSYSIVASDKYANEQQSPVFSYVVPSANNGGISLPSAGSTNLFGLQLSNLIILAVIFLAAVVLYRLKSK
jgi:hypothetical protein